MEPGKGETESKLSETMEKSESRSDGGVKEEEVGLAAVRVSHVDIPLLPSAATATTHTNDGENKRFPLLSNVMPTKPIDGFERIQTTTMKEAVVRAVTGIFNTEPRNLGMRARVRPQKRTTILSVSGMTRLTVKALDPSYWSMDDAEAGCVLDVKFDTTSRTVTVVFREDTAAMSFPEQTPPAVVAGKLGDEAFVGVNVAGSSDRAIVCVASLVAANVLAVARRREGMPTATVVAKKREGAEYYDVETRGLTHLDAKALVSTSWKGDDWPRLTNASGSPTSLPMYVDVATGTHHTCIESGRAIGALIAVAQERCPAELRFPDGVRYGFAKTYRVSADEEDVVRKRREPVEAETPERKKQCIAHKPNSS
jgi:hypothetical protein